MSKKMKWLGGTKRMKPIAATLEIFPLVPDAMLKSATGAPTLNHAASFSSTAWWRTFFAACAMAGFSLVASNALTADFTVGSGDDLAANPSTTSSAGTNWILQQDAWNLRQITVPIQAPVADYLIITHHLAAARSA